MDAAGLESSVVKNAIGSGALYSGIDVSLQDVKKECLEFSSATDVNDTIVKSESYFPCEDCDGGDVVRASYSGSPSVMKNERPETVVKSEAVPHPQSGDSDGINVHCTDIDISYSVVKNEYLDYSKSDPEEENILDKRRRIQRERRGSYTSSSLSPKLPGRGVCRGAETRALRSTLKKMANGPVAPLDNLEIAAVSAICAYAYYNYVNIYFRTKIKKPWKRRRCWMTSIHRNRTRHTMENQLSKLLTEQSCEFENFLRMSLADFEYILNKVSPLISKKDTQLRVAIPARVRLAITLRFLATGDSYRSLHFVFNISSEVISRIVPEVCSALNNVLKDQIKIPSTTEEWLDVEKGFNKNFPHAIGAIDGRYIAILAPPHTSTQYYNYKRTLSIVLTTLVDSNYRFLFADIESDGGVFRNCHLWHRICDNTLNLPTPRPLPGSRVALPYVFLGDGAFDLSTRVMKPYRGKHALNTPKRVFNETLSRSRALVDNTFGMLAAKFRVFKKPIPFCVEKVKILTMTCILLHNFLIKSQTSRHVYMSPGTVDSFDEDGVLQEGLWRQDVLGTCAIRPVHLVPRKTTANATKIREEFTSYFLNNCN